MVTSDSSDKKAQRQKWSLIIVGLALAGIVIFAIIGAIFNAIFPVVEERDPQNIASDISNANGDEEREKWPILSNLPFKNALFTLGYQIETDSENNEVLTIFVDTTETYLDEALEKLASFDSSKPLSEYNVTVKSPVNPFLSDFTPGGESDPTAFLEAGYSALEKPFSVVSVEETGNYAYISLTTGSAETYNLVHYTAILERNGDSWSLLKEPTPSLLVAQ